MESSGGAITFDGTNYVQIANTNIAEDCTSYTVTLWMQSTDLQMAGNAVSYHLAGIFGKCVDAGINFELSGWTLFNDTGPDTLCGYIADTNAFAASGHNPCGFSDGGWHFVAVEWTARTTVPQVFVDTVFVGGGIESSYPHLVTETSNASHLIIGDDGTHINMTGSLSDFRIYNRVLTPHEIYDLYRWRGQP